MKQTLFLFLFIMTTSVVSAQSSPRTQNARSKANTETKTSATEHQAKADVADEEVIVNKDDVTTTGNFAAASPAVGFGNYNSFTFKNGQTATPAGHEAMAMGSGYSFFKKAVEKRLTTGNEANSGIFIRDNSSIGNNINILMHGQTATLTGHEATAINGGYASFGRKNPWNVNRTASENGEETNVNDPANNIIIYKKNGQAATKTGHEATGMGSGYSFSKKDK